MGGGLCGSRKGRRYIEEGGDHWWREIRAWTGANAVWLAHSCTRAKLYIHAKCGMRGKEVDRVHRGPGLH